MKIRLVTPLLKGNRVSALRWARILRGLGHDVVVGQRYRAGRCDLMVALHARRSHASVKRFRDRHPDLPLVLAMTGTDLYRDIRTDPAAQQSMEMASLLIVLQPMGVQELPRHLRSRARVIYQSARRPPGTFSPRKNLLEVCVIGHIRPVKDPFRTARAARLLPYSSRIRVVHVGSATSREMEEGARAEQASNPRYRWLGELPRWKALRILARSRLLAVTSRMEGGSNVVSEALACSVPVVSSRISGLIGILGGEYPGYFPVGGTRALADLLGRAESDVEFYTTLKARCKDLRPLVTPARERRSWQSLLKELHLGGKTSRKGGRTR